MGGKSRRSAPPEMSAATKGVLSGYPPSAQRRLLQLRELIFDTATTLTGVGPLTETLKWGEVSYLTEQSKSGTTIRIGWRASQPEHYALFLNCNTSLVSDFRASLESALVFEGNRAIVMDLQAPLPRARLRSCIAAALTYHLAQD